jgi:hypothetical protein
MSALLDQLRAAIRMRHFSRQTEEAYVRWAYRYIRFNGTRHPAETGAREVSVYLSHLAVQGEVAASTQNQALAALLFLYREVLDGDVGELEGLVHAKKPVRLPVAMTREGIGRAVGPPRVGHPGGVPLRYGPPPPWGSSEHS